MRKLTQENRLVVSWVENPRELEPLHEEWRVLAENVGADIYLTPDWVAVWWCHFGKGRKLSCLTAHKNGTLVGVLPFCLEDVWIGLFRFRIARLAGMDPHCVIFGLPVTADLEMELLAESLRFLIEHKRCDLVSFTPVSDCSDYLPKIHEVCGGNPSLILQDMPTGSHTVFDLPESFEAYLGNLSKKRRSQFRRDVLGLDKAYAMETELTIPCRKEFASFVELHNAQWRAVGRGGHFLDWPGSAAFYGDLADVSGEKRHLQLHKQTGGTGPLAIQFALVAGQTCHWRLPARSLDPVAERLSIGKVGLVMMIKNLIEEGVTRIEGGRGEYGYKLSYGAKNVPIHRLIVGPATKMGKFRVSVLLAWADVLNFIYYRVWFLRCAPRVHKWAGMAPRPLWRSWIRTRL